MTSPEALARYRLPRTMTRVDRHADALAPLPQEPEELCRVIQGLLVHPFHAFRYGLEHVREAELQTRRADEMLDRIFELDPAPLAEPRPPERRLVGNCRHFTTLLCALVRHQGRPARARCGFGAYFEPERYADHWVGELWDETLGRWRLVDAQIDDVQREGLGIPFDTTDISREQFWVAGQAWERARRGEVAAEHFGILDMWGLWFIQSNVLRDLAALNRVELLPWDCWGLMGARIDGDGAEATLVRLDRIAALTTGPDLDVAALTELYENDPDLRVPGKIFVAVLNREIELTLD